MEYEIQDEDALFDDSTNPSLQRHAPVREAVRSQPDPADKRKLQRAELIPEEEHQLA